MNLTFFERAQSLIANDAFSRSLGIEIVKMEQGYCLLRMKIRSDMLNGMGILHGGVSYSIADTALYLLSNSEGRVAVALDTAMSYTIAIKEGETILCEGRQEAITNKTACYLIKVFNAEAKTAGLFKGTVYRTTKEYNF